MDGLMALSLSPIQTSVWGHSAPHVFLPLSNIQEEARDELVPSICLDGASLNDIPARYTIRSVPEHSFPVIGVYIDPSVVPGFKYSVTVLPSQDTCIKEAFMLFDGEPLELQSIGRGYSRRLVFAPSSSVSAEDTTFWSDSHPGGMCFDLHVVAPGEQFNVLSRQGVLLGHCQIIRVIGPQEELEETCRGNFVEKKVKVVVESQTRWLDYRKGLTKEMVKGIAYCSAFGKSGKREILLENGTVLAAPKRGFQSLVVGDSSIPTVYEIHGILDTELPVIGTYVDARILPGLKYTIQRLPSRDALLEGKALRLSSIGRGYGKRISFRTDNANEDFEFWSDSSAEGFAFQPVPIAEGDCLKTCDGRLKMDVLRVVSRSRTTKIELTEEGIEAEMSVDLVCRCRGETTVRISGKAVCKTNGNERIFSLAFVDLDPVLTVGKSHIHKLIPG